MPEVIGTLIILIGGVIIGSFFKPTAEQTKPLSPPEGGPPASADPHHH
jgi:hypothetical protein